MDAIKNLLLTVAVTVGSKFISSDLVGRLTRTAVQKVGMVVATYGYMTGDDVTAVSGAAAAFTTTLFTIVSAILARRATPAVAANSTIGGLL